MAGSREGHGMVGGPINPELVPTVKRNSKRWNLRFARAAHLPFPYHYNFPQKLSVPQGKLSMADCSSDLRPPVFVGIQ
eukprot:631336-Prorocentrum_minimum.AAC.1